MSAFDGHSNKIHEGVPYNDTAAILRRLMSQPLLTGDIRAQMDAYIAIPDPNMITHFRKIRGEQGDNVDLREILRKFAEKLHPSVKQKFTENTKTQTKTQTKNNTNNLDDLLNPKTDTMPATTPDDRASTQNVSVKKATTADTARATSNIRPTDTMVSAMSRLQDIEVDDTDDVGYEPVEVTTDTLPAMISKELTTDGVQSPKFHQVASLPGNMSRVIRHVGKKLFGSFTRTPTEDIHMIGDLGGMGPNSHIEVNSVAGWVKKNGVPVTDISSIDFGGVMPGYTAEYQLYDAGGVRWMLIQDSVDGEYMGKYIYMWPQQDSLDTWQDQDKLPGRVGRVLESVNYYLKKYSK